MSPLSYSLSPDQPLLLYTPLVFATYHAIYGTCTAMFVFTLALHLCSLALYTHTQRQSLTPLFHPQSPIELLLLWFTSLFCTNSHATYFILCPFHFLPIYTEFYSAILTNMLTNHLSSFHNLPFDYLNNPAFSINTAPNHIHTLACSYLELQQVNS